MGGNSAYADGIGPARTAFIEQSTATENTAEEPANSQKLVARSRNAGHVVTCSKRQIRASFKRILETEETLSKGLVIVESPAKAKTIQKYLGKGFTVEASLGHVKDLPKSTLGVDVDNDFETEYVVIPGKEKVVAKLKKLAAGVDTIYLAPDPDREGEAIAAHLAQELGDGAKSKKKKKKGENGIERFRRVTFNEVSQRVLRHAF